jgi:hypothetical protein
LIPPHTREDECAFVVDGELIPRMVVTLRVGLRHGEVYQLSLEGLRS